MASSDSNNISSIFFLLWKYGKLNYFDFSLKLQFQVDLDESLVYPWSILTDSKISDIPDKVNKIIIITVCITRILLADSPLLFLLVQHGHLKSVNFYGKMRRKFLAKTRRRRRPRTSDNNNRRHRRCLLLGEQQSHQSTLRIEIPAFLCVCWNNIKWDEAWTWWNSEREVERAGDPKMRSRI